MNCGRAELGRASVKIDSGRAEAARAGVKIAFHCYRCPAQLSTSIFHPYPLPAHLCTSPCHRYRDPTSLRLPRCYFVYSIGGRRFDARLCLHIHASDGGGHIGVGRAMVAVKQWLRLAARFCRATAPRQTRGVCSPCRSGLTSTRGRPDTRNMVAPAEAGHVAPAEARHVAAAEAAVETWPRAACDKGHMCRSHSTTKSVTPTTPTPPIVSGSRSDLYRGKLHHVQNSPERDRMQGPLQNPGAVLHPRMRGTAGRALHTARRAVHRRRKVPSTWRAVHPRRPGVRRPASATRRAVHPRRRGEVARAAATPRRAQHPRRQQAAQ